MDDVQVRRLTPADHRAAEKLLATTLGSRHQVRMEEWVDVLAAAGFGAWADGRLVGVATWDFDGRQAELLSLAVAREHRGEGLAGQLLEAVVGAATADGCEALRLVTTNDNLDAVRLYQRHGLRLVEVRAGAVDRARQLKPGIPLIGEHGIPMHDELVLVRPLT